MKMKLSEVEKLEQEREDDALVLQLRASLLRDRI